jgi:hypothetical protein
VVFVLGLKSQVAGIPFENLFSSSMQPRTSVLGWKTKNPPPIRGFERSEASSGRLDPPFGCRDKVENPLFLRNRVFFVSHPFTQASLAQARKQKIPPPTGTGFLTFEVSSGFEPLYEVLQTSA